MPTPRKLTRPNHMTNAERDEAVRLFRAGMTHDQLCDRYGRGLTTIKALLRRRGVRRCRISVDSSQ